MQEDAVKTRLSCLCRGNGKVYALFEIKEVSDGASITASCALPNGTPTVWQTIELLPENGTRRVVVAFPLSPHKIAIKLTAETPAQGGAANSEVVYDDALDPQYIKWASRFNYRLNSKKAHMIRDCEKDGAITRDEIELGSMIPLEESAIFRCVANMPGATSPDYEIRIYDSDFAQADITPIKMGETVIPKGKRSPVPVLTTNFSLRLPNQGLDYTVALFRDGKVAAFETISKYRMASLRDGYNKATQNAAQNPEYPGWYEMSYPTEVELLTQSRIEFDYAPLISIVVPLYNTDPKLFGEMAESVIAQSYANWELVLVNSTPENAELAAAVKAYADGEPRIRVVPIEKNLGITLNTKVGIEAASGEFVAFLDHDDTIAPNALYEYVFALDQNPDLDVFYSDSDHMGTDGSHMTPYFKPDYSKYLMREVNYMCHFRMVRADLLSRIDVGEARFDGAQDHDMLLKCLELTDRVHHCPKVLYSWRMTPESAAAGVDNKPYANTAARTAIQEHLQRLGIEAEVVDSTDSCRFHTIYKVAGNPKVSILIPSKDNVEILNTCVKSVLEKSTYENFEIIIIENNSTEPETFENYEMLKGKDGRIEVIEWGHEFNFSKIMNFGAEHATGEYLLPLNNDTEVITPDWIEQLLGLCQQEDVGAVGAKLFYPDSSIQHGGVYVQGEGAGHININLSSEASGYFNTTRTTREVSAVTAACLICPRSVYDEVEGFDPDFAVAFNDVDFCMKIRQAGYKVVFNPNCQLYHYESISRGYENTQEKILRFGRETALLRYRWSDQYILGDPYMNINLNEDCGYFNLLPLEEIRKIQG